MKNIKYPFIIYGKQGSNNKFNFKSQDIFIRISLILRKTIPMNKSLKNIYLKQKIKILNNFI